ncbi:long-chain fatty-acid-CoA ligase [Talaromyces proteolyticus]|uniref:Long-chain fatty-acid-CoA ligase n=1 Tax=Talaromyces proteolyticus TaxID=1131652 RepID=A0AAD4PSH6_9EURO|nr:long-chain fatty-acid-CoA ligase [Talaromyces proteolyticus]KAH8691356.1 long-chain fatty-acid-CoA ligase [Talaromyces proteolyticus]
MALSLASGPRDQALWHKTLGTLIDEQAQTYGDRLAVVFPQQNVQRTYNQLAERSHRIANALYQSGLQPGDGIGVLAGNCYQYIEIFLAGGYAGCSVVVLNNTYSPEELQRAISISKCKMLCIAPSIGKKSLEEHVKLVRDSENQVKEIVLLSGSFLSGTSTRVSSYSSFVDRGSVPGNQALARQRQTAIKPDDLLNLQFTSGTTGSPKAAMLTHVNLINNGRFVGDKMLLTPDDVVCCPPPLFHCFGLVMGFLGAFTHGSAIVFPSEQFDADLVLDAVAIYKCTALLGVPTMFVAELEANRRKNISITTVRTGLAAGSPVPMVIMKQLEEEMNIRSMLIAYGMTETSPVTFLTAVEDPLERRLKTVGKVMPHTSAKIIDTDGRIVPIGVRGEICTSGYALQKGYWENEEKTREVMKRDENGILWMYTGDEGVIDSEGYCTITGRIKDIIIRGGENIFPVEIEERLLAHTRVSEACVVAVPDEKYGEVVGCFLRHDPLSRQRPPNAEIRSWAKQTMGSHKAPQYVWWVGDVGVGEDFPKTGSGKYQKHILRDVARKLIKSVGGVRAKL